MKKSALTVAFALCAALAIPAVAHVKDQPSVHDTLASAIERFRETQPPEKIVTMDLEDVIDALTEEEKDILGSNYLSFRVNVPVMVSVFREVRLGEDPFWLDRREFEKTDLKAKVDGREFDVWEKTFPAGRVGLGVNSLTGHGEHYFVGIQPEDGEAKVEITEIYPGQHKTGVLEKKAQPYFDDDAEIEELPEELSGQILLQGSDDNRRQAQLVDIFRFTRYPATPEPDQVVLTWSDDPKTTQAIQWRTSTDTQTGVVEFQKKSDFSSFHPKTPMRVAADTKPLEVPTLVNDPVVHRHSAVLTGLEPDTTYVYSVGSGSQDDWTELSEFTTAPDASDVPFSFVYMGDAQNGLDRWGSLIKQAFLRRPDAAFWVMAGDLVNRGAERDDWDLFFHNSANIYDRRQLVPALGNHEYHGGGPRLYLEQFTLPTNGPDTIDPEKAYSFSYSNAFFVVLDSNLPPETQTEWLDAELSASDATWKFVVYHHPSYSSGPRRDNPEIRKLWGDIFDKHHVDVALQGHDHAYLRTYPMKAGNRVESPAEGTIYIVSVSGTKFYDQAPHDYTEFGMTNTSTYQVLDILIFGDKLIYKAHDLDGNVLDEFTIEKNNKRR